MRKDYYLQKAFFWIDLRGILIIAFFLMMLLALTLILKKKNNYTYIQNNNEFIGWYNDKDSLISLDFHYPYGGTFQMKDSVLNLTAKFKNVK